MHFIYSVSKTMGEKKFPADLVEGLHYKSQEPVLLPAEPDDQLTRRRRPLSTCILFLLLGLFVFSLACFAVYTAISMDSWHNNAVEKESVVKPSVMEQKGDDLVVAKTSPAYNRMKPIFDFELVVNGKKVLGNDNNKTTIISSPVEEKPEKDDFFKIINSIKQILGLGKQLSSKPDSSRETLFEETPKPKIKTISIQSWQIERKPSETPFPFPPMPFDMFDFAKPLFDLPSSIFSNSREREVKKVGTEKKLVTYPVTPVTTSPISNSSKEDNTFPRTIFKDFQDDLFNLDKVSDTQTNPSVDVTVHTDIKPKPVVLKKSQSLFPFSIFMNRLKPREEVEVFKKMEEPYPVKLEKKTEMQDDDWYTFPLSKSEMNKKQSSFTGISPAFYEDEEPDLFYFKEPFLPKWPVASKKTKNNKKVNNGEVDGQEDIKIPTQTPEFSTKSTEPTRAKYVLPTTSKSDLMSTTSKSSQEDMTTMKVPYSSSTPKNMMYRY